ncbi:FISUMP domain-containing protein [Fibrobacter sp. HC4]|uniref:FISUMP domain-containing protein n=1 Tax=Fibrobacter sp. HC4 TaxID=3239812 RepID=UPI000DC45C97|nr:FISUMP domain-containing protein [Fibrobacter succinogenes]MCL4101548.1 hypothetical protein [Fibrobacter succinogenes]
MKNYFKTWGGIATLSLMALTTALTACGNQETAGGTSEEAEGIVAITDKTIAGVSQKGPFLKGSTVIIKETASDGSLTPTGKEFETTIRSDKGDYKFSNLDLKTQYAIFSAEGYYQSEETEEKSNCPIHLEAVSDIEGREKVNINILTHFEHKRVINLVKEGKSFSKAKKQASEEVLQAFGVDVQNYSAENLNIFNMTEADLVLYNLSLYIDHITNRTYYYHETEEESCQNAQNVLDSYANDFADDGELSDSLLSVFIDIAYEGQLRNEEGLTLEGIDEKEKVDPGSRLDLTILGNEYLFGTMLFTNYMEVEPCGESQWGVIKPIKKSITLGGDYLICNAFYWEIITKEEYEEFTAPIKHQVGSMTDKRDGKKYSTVSFKHKGKTYEWMAENLLYTDSTVHYSDKKLPGSYNWTTAMNLDSSYKKKTVDISLIDSLHQGICPDNWHIATNDEWEALIKYVGDARNLLDEKWKISDRKFALAKDIFGVFHNKFDFNLTPTDYEFLETYYHTYARDSKLLNYVSFKDMYGECTFDEKLEADAYDDYYEKYYEYMREHHEYIEGGFSIELEVLHGSVYDNFRSNKEDVAYVRCVKN